MTQISTTGRSPKNSRTKTRIQKENETRILTAALDVFSENGFRGATLDRIASTANMSKPNLLYYFKSKEEIHVALLTGLLDVWLAPLREISPHGEPADEIGSYIRRKLESSRQFPRESRLFANEMLAGAPHIEDFLQNELKQLSMRRRQSFRNGSTNSGSHPASRGIFCSRSGRRPSITPISACRCAMYSACNPAM